MALKRKLNAEDPSRPVKKASKVKPNSKNELPTVSAKVPRPEIVTEDSPSEDEFRDTDMEKSGTDDEEDSEQDTDELDNQSEELDPESPKTSKSKGNSQSTTCLSLPV